MLDVRRFPARLTFLFAVLGYPFLRFLLCQRYGVLYPEVGLSFLLLLAAAAAGAFVSRKLVVFHIIAVVTITLVSVGAVQAFIAPSVRSRVVIVALLMGLGALASLFKSRLYPILLVFILGAFAVDAGRAALTRFGDRREDVQEVRVAGPKHHVIHVVLDEMIRLGALPMSCPECVKARDEFDRVLRDGNFTVYENAFSNYDDTRDSLGSILNHTLLKHGQTVLGPRGAAHTSNGENEFFPGGGAHPVLTPNAYFDEYRKRNYTVQVYQSEWLLFADPIDRTTVRRTYGLNSLSALHSVNMSWTERLKELWNGYVLADKFWSYLLEGHFPGLLLGWPSFGTITSTEMWPDRVLENIRRADRDTLFFIHVLAPHYPYVYNADGSTRPYREWRAPMGKRAYTPAEALQYWERFSQYCAQSAYVARQLGRFLEGIRKMGQYETATVIVHGDHGSRFVLVNEEEMESIQVMLGLTSGCPKAGPAFRPASYTNMFAALLAIKIPGAKAAAVVSRPGSILFFLRQAFGPPVAKSDERRLNTPYSFNAQGQACPIDITPTKLENAETQYSAGN